MKPTDNREFKSQGCQAQPFYRWFVMSKKGLGQAQLRLFCFIKMFKNRLTRHCEGARRATEANSLFRGDCFARQRTWRARNDEITQRRPNMLKRLISLILVTTFCVTQAGPAYALRPANAAGSNVAGKLSADIAKAADAAGNVKEIAKIFKFENVQDLVIGNNGIMHSLYAAAWIAARNGKPAQPALLYSTKSHVREAARNSAINETIIAVYSDDPSESFAGDSAKSGYFEIVSDEARARELVSGAKATGVDRFNEAFAASQFYKVNNPDIRYAVKHNGNILSVSSAKTGLPVLLAKMELPFIALVKTAQEKAELLQILKVVNPNFSKCDVVDLSEYDNDLQIALQKSAILLLGFNSLDPRRDALAVRYMCASPEECEFRITPLDDIEDRQVHLTQNSISPESIKDNLQTIMTVDLGIVGLKKTLTADEVKANETAYDEAEALVKSTAQANAIGRARQDFEESFAHSLFAKAFVGTHNNACHILAPELVAQGGSGLGILLSRIQGLPVILLVNTGKEKEKLAQKAGVSKDVIIAFDEYGNDLTATIGAAVQKFISKTKNYNRQTVIRYYHPRGTHDLSATDYLGRVGSTRFREIALSQTTLTKRPLRLFEELQRHMLIEGLGSLTREHVAEYAAYNDACMLATAIFGEAEAASAGTYANGIGDILRGIKRRFAPPTAPLSVPAVPTVEQPVPTPTVVAASPAPANDSEALDRLNRIIDRAREQLAPDKEVTDLAIYSTVFNLALDLASSVKQNVPGDKEQVLAQYLKKAENLLLVDAHVAQAARKEAVLEAAFSGFEVALPETKRSEGKKTKITVKLFGEPFERGADKTAEFAAAILTGQLLYLTEEVNPEMVTADNLNDLDNYLMHGQIDVPKNGGALQFDVTRILDSATKGTDIADSAETLRKDLEMANYCKSASNIISVVNYSQRQVFYDYIQKAAENHGYIGVVAETLANSEKVRPAIQADPQGFLDVIAKMPQATAQTAPNAQYAKALIEFSSEVTKEYKSAEVDGFIGDLLKDAEHVDWVALSVDVPHGVINLFPHDIDATMRSGDSENISRFVKKAVSVVSRGNYAVRVHRSAVKTRGMDLIFKVTISRGEKSEESTYAAMIAARKPVTVSGIEELTSAIVDYSHNLTGEDAKETVLYCDFPGNDVGEYFTIFNPIDVNREVVKANLEAMIERYYPDVETWTIVKKQDGVGVKPANSAAAAAGIGADEHPSMRKAEGKGIVTGAELPATVLYKTHGGSGYVVKFNIRTSNGLQGPQYYRALLPYTDELKPETKIMCRVEDVGYNPEYRGNVDIRVKFLSFAQDSPGAALAAAGAAGQAQAAGAEDENVRIAREKGIYPGAALEGIVHRELNHAVLVFLNIRLPNPNTRYQYSGIAVKVNFDDAFNGKTPADGQKVICTVLSVVPTTSEKQKVRITLSISPPETKKPAAETKALTLDDDGLLEFARQMAVSMGTEEKPGAVLLSSLAKTKFNTSNRNIGQLMTFFLDNGWIPLMPDKKNPATWSVQPPAPGATRPAAQSDTKKNLDPKQTYTIERNSNTYIIKPVSANAVGGQETANQQFYIDQAARAGVYAGNILIGIVNSSSAHVHAVPGRGRRITVYLNYIPHRVNDRYKGFTYVNGEKAPEIGRPIKCKVSKVIYDSHKPGRVFITLRLLSPVTATASAAGGGYLLPVPEGAVKDFKEALGNFIQYMLAPDGNNHMAGQTGVFWSNIDRPDEWKFYNDADRERTIALDKLPLEDLEKEAEAVFAAPATQQELNHNTLFLTAKESKYPWIYYHILVLSNTKLAVNAFLQAEAKINTGLELLLDSGLRERAIERVIAYRYGGDPDKPRACDILSNIELVKDLKKLYAVAVVIDPNKANWPGWEVKLTAWGFKTIYIVETLQEAQAYLAEENTLLINATEQQLAIDAGNIPVETLNLNSSAEEFIAALERFRSA